MDYINTGVSHCWLIFPVTREEECQYTAFNVNVQTFYSPLKLWRDISHDFHQTKQVILHQPIVPITALWSVTVSIITSYDLHLEGAAV